MRIVIPKGSKKTQEHQKKKMPPKTQLDLQPKDEFIDNDSHFPDMSPKVSGTSNGGFPVPYKAIVKVGFPLHKPYPYSLST